VGPNVEKLLQYKKEKERRERKEAEQRQRMERANPSQQQKPPVEEKIEEERPKQIIQDETGRIRDEKGNVINIKVKKFSLLF
jgi:hypothetical protein